MSTSILFRGRTRVAVLASAALLLTAPVQAQLAPQVASPGQDGLPRYDASDPSAAEVTADDLLHNERFWPFHVTVPEPHLLPDGQTIKAGRRGVLMRVLDAQTARIDMGRYGVHDLPIDATNLISEANRIRLGEKRKRAPNAIAGFGSWMLDSNTSDAARPYPYEAVFFKRGFLLAFADPQAEGFAEVAAQMRSLAGRYGIQSALVPQGGGEDERVWRSLRKADWPVPYTYERVSRSLTQGILGDAPAPPAFVLMTCEGRHLLRGAIDSNAGDRVARAMEDAFGDTEMASASR